MVLCFVAIIENGLISHHYEPLWAAKHLGLGEETASLRSQ